MFFTTAKLFDGKLELFDLHLDRMNQTRNHFFKTERNWELEKLYEEIKKYSLGLFRVRIDYDIQINKITVTPYSLKPHSKLKIMDAGDFQYTFKADDRRFFESSLAENPDCDDILFTKNGFLTDTTYCNIALLGGQKWVTPKTYLLAGIKRKNLLNQGLLFEADINQNALPDYSKIAFINAMRDFEMVYNFTVSGSIITLELCKEGFKDSF